MESKKGRAAVAARPYVMRKRFVRANAQVTIDASGVLIVN